MCRRLTGREADAQFVGGLSWLQKLFIFRSRMRTPSVFVIWPRILSSVLASIKLGNNGALSALCLVGASELSALFV